MLACWALFQKENQESWQSIAYNIFSVQTKWHNVPWIATKIYFLSTLAIWEITIQSDQQYRQVKFVEQASPIHNWGGDKMEVHHKAAVE